MKNLARIVLVSSLFLFAGCAGPSATDNTGRGMSDAAATLNSKCVVSGEALDAKSPTVAYMGGKVGFCCKDCVAKWNDMDDAAKKAAVAKAK
ncbi:MAG: hypothetical protein WAT39_25355 [Planctomycetota bacterium]